MYIIDNPKKSKAIAGYIIAAIISDYPKGYITRYSTFLLRDRGSYNRRS